MTMIADRERSMVKSERVISVFMAGMSFRLGFCLNFGAGSLKIVVRHSLEGSAVEGASHSTRLVTHGVTRFTVTAVVRRR